MALYYNEPLVAQVPPALKARMQGKTCFNFRKVDRERFGELLELTRLGVRSYAERGAL